MRGKVIINITLRLVSIFQQILLTEGGDNIMPNSKWLMMVLSILR